MQTNTQNQYAVFNRPPGQRSLYYDYLGNLTNETLPSEEYQQYTYDYLNRLTIYLDTVDTTYRYDALGRRITKNYTGLQTHYVYDGAGLIEVRRSISGAAESSVTTSS